MNNDYYDVIIAGGGVSGSTAAIACARMNVKTLLIERYGFCGGTLTNSGVGPMMTFHAGDKQIVDGIAQEIVDELVKRGASPGHIDDMTGYASSVTPFDAEELKHVLDDMLIESGCNILYHTMVSGCSIEDGRLKSVKVSNKKGIYDIKGKVFIDATGDGDLFFFSKVPFFKGREQDGLCQPMTMNLKISGVDTKKIREVILKDPQNHNVAVDKVSSVERISVSGFKKELALAKANREIDFEREVVLFFETNNPGEVILNMTRIIKKDAVCPEDLTLAEIEGRKQAAQAFKFLKKRIPGFEDSVLISTGTQIGIRESRRVMASYILTKEDLLSSKQFPDTVAKGGYPIDIHNPSGNFTQSVHLAPGQVYNIPYRSMLNDYVPNLIISGRCIGATHEAGAAIRVTPIAMAIGQACGSAAALSIIQSVEPKDIRWEVQSE